MIRLFILILLQGMLVVGAECFLKVALSKMAEFSWTWAFFKDARKYMGEKTGIEKQ